MSVCMDSRCKKLNCKCVLLFYRFCGQFFVIYESKIAYFIFLFDFDLVLVISKHAVNMIFKSTGCMNTDIQDASKSLLDYQATNSSVNQHRKAISVSNEDFNLVFPP